MSLLTNLISFWKLGEASGNRADSYGSNTLAASGSPANTTGKVGSAVQLVSASSQYLSIADASQANLDPGTSDFAISLWIYPDTLPSVGALVFKGTAASGTGQGGYWLYSNASGALNVRFSDGSASYVMLQTATGVVTTGAWHHVVVNFTRSGNVQIFVNTVSKGTLSISAQSGAVDSIRAFGVGAALSPTAGSFFNGRIDALGFWKRVLTTDEINTLYNAGAGLEHPFSTIVPRRRAMVLGV